MTGLLMLAGSVAYFVWLFSRPAQERAKQARWHAEQERAAARWRETLPETLVARASDPLEAVRSLTASQRGGVYLGITPDHREWTTAPSEQAVLVIGPPRSGKTSSLIVPTILSAAGPVVSTSTKADILAATARARSRYGRVWLFDPSGTEPVPDGVLEVHWSPVRSARTWDGARAVADAMVGASSAGQGVQDAGHWVESAKMLLAPMLHAAALMGATISDVLTWINRGNPVPAGEVLDEAGAATAADLLESVFATEDRERSSIFSTARVILAAYGSDAATARSRYQNFDAERFVQSLDTLYITAPSHLQNQLTPLVAGLLEEIRDAAFNLARQRAGGRARPGPPVLWALDELANIAPLKNLPNLVSEAGGQGLQILACFQDLSQARARWGPAADGFLTLFNTKVVFAGVGDKATLEALSTLAGDWDRPYSAFNSSTGSTVQFGPGMFGSRGTNQTSAWNYSAQREAQITPYEVANIPPRHALVIRTDHIYGNRWGLVEATPYYCSQPWHSVGAAAPRHVVAHGAADALPAAYGQPHVVQRGAEFLEAST